MKEEHEAGTSELAPGSMSALLGSLAKIRGFVSDIELATWGPPTSPINESDGLDKSFRLERIGGLDPSRDERDLSRLFDIRVQVACLSLSQLTDVELEQLATESGLAAGEIAAARELAASISAGDATARSAEAQSLFEELAPPVEGGDDLLGILRRTGRWPGDPSVPLIRDYRESLALAVLRHARYAVWQVVRIVGHPPPLLLVLTGLEGLQDAIERFNPHRGKKLSTYARHWVRARVQRTMSATGTDVRVPRSIEKDWLTVRRLMLDLVLASKSPQPTDFISVSAARADADRIGNVGLSPPLDAWNTYRADGSLEVDALFDDQQLTTRHFERQRAFTRLLRDSVPQLTTPRYRDIIERRFRLDGRDEAETLESIGQSYCLTRERIRQVEDQAIASLADAVGSEIVSIVQELESLRQPTTIPLSCASPSSSLRGAKRR